MATCKGCGAEIIWIGKMPCDPERVPYWAKEKAKGKYSDDLLDMNPQQWDPYE